MLTEEIEELFGVTARRALLVPCRGHGGAGLFLAERGRWIDRQSSSGGSGGGSSSSGGGSSSGCFLGPILRWWCFSTQGGWV